MLHGEPHRAASEVACANTPVVIAQTFSGSYLSRPARRTYQRHRKNHRRLEYASRPFEVGAWQRRKIHHPCAGSQRFQSLRGRARGRARRARNGVGFPVTTNCHIAGRGLEHHGGRAHDHVRRPRAPVFGALTPDSLPLDHNGHDQQHRERISAEKIYGFPVPRKSRLKKSCRSRGRTSATRSR
jgi:hypothetical protein